jgi:hypothetical protein
MKAVALLDMNMSESIQRIVRIEIRAVAEHQYIILPELNVADKAFCSVCNIVGRL